MNQYSSRNMTMTRSTINDPSECRNEQSVILHLCLRDDIYLSFTMSRRDQYHADISNNSDEESHGIHDLHIVDVNRWVDLLLIPLAPSIIMYWCRRASLTVCCSNVNRIHCWVSDSS